MAEGALPGVQKSFWLWNPVPRGQERDMAMDAPDQTESPNTIPAGWFQVESFVGNLTLTGARRFSELALVSSLYKVGLSDNIDFHLGIDPYIQTAGTTGFGDLTLRAKWNIVGNDDGQFAVAALPFVSIPTQTGDDVGSDDIEGGIVFPWSLDLAENWGVGGQLQMDVTRASIAFSGTLGLGRSFSESVGGYLETLVAFPGGSAMEVMLDGGLTVAVTDDWILFAGMNKGLTGEKVWNPFAGFGWRY